MLAHGNQEVACPNICPYAGEQTNFLSFCIFLRMLYVTDVES